MCRLIELLPRCKRCKGRHDRRGPTITDPYRGTAGRPLLWPSGSGLDCTDELKLDPHPGVTVIFRSKRGDRLKILVWMEPEWC
jgi:hypothetical protein